MAQVPGSLPPNVGDPDGAAGSTWSSPGCRQHPGRDPVGGRCWALCLRCVPVPALACTATRLAVGYAKLHCL